MARGMGLVAPRHVGSSRTRARTRVPCIERRILNHCTTREVPKVGLFKNTYISVVEDIFLTTVLLFGEDIRRTGFQFWL